MVRALGVGVLALGSKAAMVMKSGGGLGTLAKGAGLLAAGGGFRAVLKLSAQWDGDLVQPDHLRLASGGAAAAVSSRTGQQRGGEAQQEHVPRR